MPSNNKNNLVKFVGKFAGCLFPRPPKVLGVGEDTYGITRWEIVEVIDGEINSDSMLQNDVVTVTGEFSDKINPMATYQILAKPIVHPQYGPQYNLLYINELIDFSSMYNQKSFLKSFLTENQVTELYKTLSNPIEAIANHDVEALKKVKGIKTYIANVIINKYEANKDVSQIYCELDEYGLTPRFIQSLMRTYSSPSAVIKAVKENPYKLIDDVSGVGFKKADEIALRGGLSPKSINRIAAYIKFFLEEQADEGNSYVTAGELLTNVFEFFGGKDSIVEDVTVEINGELKSTNNVSEAIRQLTEKQIIQIENTEESKSRRRVYLTRIYNLENEIAFHLNRLLTANNNFDYQNWEEYVHQLEEKQGFPFAEEQLNGIKLGLDKQVCLISGLAGSGKSSLVAGILAALPQYDFAQCALSGKAAARLQEVTGKDGMTIHRLLKFNPSEGFYYNKDNPLPHSIIILDEISLVGGEIFVQLLRAIPDGSKLIMLGDMGQLESIGALNLAADLHDSPVIPTVELTQIHRQAAKSGIITTARKVRNQEQLYTDKNYEGIEIRGELKDMIMDVTQDSSQIRGRVSQWFTKLYNSKLVNQDIMKIQVIAPVRERGNSCVYTLNTNIQNIVNPIQDDEDVVEIGTKNFPSYIHLNDKVMCIKNNYNTTNLEGNTVPIFNGWVGIVKELTEDHAAIYFPLADDTIYVLRRALDGQFVLGYASTCHKIQGSDFPAIIGALDYSTPPKMLTNSLLYTMITRAKKMCVVVTQNGALYKSISTNLVSTKRTFLKELLLEKAEGGKS